MLHFPDGWQTKWTGASFNHTGNEVMIATLEIAHEGVAKARRSRRRFIFTLPHGYLESEGNLHKEGVIRLATAFDKIAPMKDPRLQTNPYLVVILLSRVIKRLGDPEHINPKVIESLFTGFAFLQDFYRRINGNGHPPRGNDVPGEVVLQL